MNNTELTDTIAAAILYDVTCRSGWRQEWDHFDEDIQDEIRDQWRKIIREVLERE